MRSLRTAFAAACALCLALPGSALIIIDNFEEGDFNAQDDTTTPTSTTIEGSGFSTANVAGGVRQITVSTTIGSLPLAPVIGTTTLTTSPADDNATFSVLTTPEFEPLLTGGHADFRFVWDGIADGTQNGAGGALGLDFSALTHVQVDVVAPASTSTLTLTLWSKGGGLPGFQQKSLALTDGANSFALGDFNAINLSNIRTIWLDIGDVKLGDTPLLAQIAAVPEPSTALLMAAGLLVVAAARRPRR